MINHTETVTTETARFMIEQRNAGFADNDGRWVVSQMAELYWGVGGVLRERRPGTFLGVFDNRASVDAAIAEATTLPIDDRMVR